MTFDAEVIYVKANNLLLYKSAKNFRGDLSDVNEKTLESANYIAYRLVQGELWAQHHMHNGKLVRGYTMTSETDGEYIVSPDGKTKFKKNWSTYNGITCQSRSANE